MKRPIIAAVLMLTAIALSGCTATTPCAELQVYAAGLHPLDESLYTQHTALMTDAVKAGLRTPVDQQVVTAEIQQAESQYSHATATTQPAK